MYKREVDGVVFPRPYEPVRLRPYDNSALTDFAINEYGHIRSDFSVLTETNDLMSMQKLLNSVMSYSQKDENKGKSLEQIFAEIRPRNVETPAEMDRFEKFCIDKALDFYQKLKDNKLARLSEGAPADGASSTVNGVKVDSSPSPSN